MFEIVIIDDEKWIRKLIKNLLPFKKYPIKITGEGEDGLEGLELVKRFKPDIVLTDIRMPHLSGLDLISEIKKSVPESEIIIISGYDNFDYAQRALKLGVLDFILKPVEEEELEEAVNKAISHINEKKGNLNKTVILEKKVHRLSAEYIKLDKNEFDYIKNDKIRKALKYIHENFNKTISLNDVCDAVIINISYFSQVFKSELGIGFNQYLMDLRFNEAKRLLEKEKDLKIGDISMIVGFHDCNYFSRLFKKKFNCTAQEYRNKTKNDD